MRRLLTAAVVLLASVLLAPAALSQATSFADLVQQLRASPGDAALRERVVAEGAAQRPKPAIPEAARAAFVQANTMVQAATDSAGQRLAIGRYNAAIDLAPWWGDAYYNRGLAQELVGDLEGAKTSYRLYLRSNPSAADARTAQDKIYGVEGRLALRSAATPPPSPPQVVPASDNLIVPGERVGQIRLGITEAELLSLIGPPKTRERLPGQFEGWPPELHLRYENPNVNVRIRLGRVFAVGVLGGAPLQTREGLAVGGAERDVEALLGQPCKRYMGSPQHPTSSRRYASGLSVSTGNGRIGVLTVWEPGEASFWCR